MKDNYVFEYLNENDFRIFEGVTNLTNITDDEGIAMRHFVDSLTLIKYLRGEQKKQKKEIQIKEIRVILKMKERMNQNKRKIYSLK